MTRYVEVQRKLEASPRRWLVTGAAGFIGSHLVEKLLLLRQTVVGLDNFSTGYQRNLDEVSSLVGPDKWKNFRFIEGDITRLEDCRNACDSVDYVLHQAALGSVPRSIADPIASHRVNVDGFINMLVAARDTKVQRFVYASSSSVYGDHPGLPKVEHTIGRPLSPYAATKLVDEIYASVFSRCYDLQTIGLRYFNVFGPRQNPAGPYSAVIPRWFALMLRDLPVTIYGDGKTSRDFCFIENVIQANLCAATIAAPAAVGLVYNIACGERTPLRELFCRIRGAIDKAGFSGGTRDPELQSEREGDVRHSLADIGLAVSMLGYSPTHTLDEGLQETCQWHCREHALDNRKKSA